MVLIDPEGSILFEYYGSNQGNPVRIVLPQLRELYAQCGDRITIKGAAVTGYGEDLIKNAFSCDLGLVETVAHLTAARHFTPEVDFIIDIGGQDMKCFKIRNGAVDSILLNGALLLGLRFLRGDLCQGPGIQHSPTSPNGPLRPAPW